MKLFFSLSLLLSLTSSLVAMEDIVPGKELMKALTPTQDTVFFSQAYKGDDLSRYKQVYLTVYGLLANGILDEEQLRQRFDSLQSLIGEDKDFNWINFTQGEDKKPVGFLPFFKKTMEEIPSAIIYDTPILPQVKEQVIELFPYIIHMFKIKKAYCFVGNRATLIQEMVEQMGYSEDNNAPFTPNDKIVWNPQEYTKYSKDLTNN